MSCPICGKEFCYARRHESLCECGTFNQFNEFLTDSENITFKCPSCGKVTKVERKFGEKL